MRLPREYQDDDRYLNDVDVDHEDDQETLSHKRAIRRKLEERLERKRLREEIDDYDDEFDWDDFDR